MLQACIAGRREGPLLQKRQQWEGRRKTSSVASTDELLKRYEDKLAKAPAGSVVTEQDRKQLFRRLLREFGGVSADQLAKEYKTLFKALGVGAEVTLYTLRGSVTTSMAQARMPHLELRYLTSHATNDILNHYVGLDPSGAMQFYFASIGPLLEAIAHKARAFGWGVS